MIRRLQHKVRKAHQHHWAPAFALMAVSAVWGSTFVMTANTIAQYPMFAFLSLRFAIASVMLVIISPKVFKKFTAPNVGLGLIAGLILSFGYMLQTASLLPAAQGGTTPARSAFLTGLYVVAVPVIQAIWRRKFPNGGVIVGVLLALGGLWALSGLSLLGGGLSHWVRGDTLVMLGALAYSLHIILLGRAGKEHDARALSVIQLIFLAVATGFASLIAGEHAPIPHGWTIWSALLVTGILASALAYSVQTWAQLKLPPSRVALILVLEPAFGGAFGWLAAGHIVVREACGAILMIGGMISSEIISARKADAKSTPLELEMPLEGIPVISED